MSGMELRKTIEIDAPAREVFRALTDSKELTQWWPDIGTFEPRLGGKFHFTFLAKHLLEMGDKEMGDRDRQLGGEVLELVLDKKLAYTFIPDKEYRPDGMRFKPTVVTWNLEQIGKNRTKVTLVHSGFAKDMDKHFKDVTAGWNYFTARLVDYCKNK